MQLGASAVHCKDGTAALNYREELLFAALVTHFSPSVLHFIKVRRPYSWSLLQGSDA